MVPSPNEVHFKYVDLLSMAERMYPVGTVLSRNLGALHKDLFGQLNGTEHWHSALFDAQATAQIALRWLDRLESGRKHGRSELRLSTYVDWP